MLEYVTIQLEKLVKSRTSVLLKDNNPNKKLVSGNPAVWRFIRLFVERPHYC